MHFCASGKGSKELGEKLKMALKSSSRTWPLSETYIYVSGGQAQVSEAGIYLLPTHVTLQASITTFYQRGE